MIGMEACSGAHHWARLFARHGHTVRLMARKFVVPYHLSGKRGKNDAAAICEAVARPNMHFVPVKSRQLMQLTGVAETTASALVTTIGRGQDFRCGCQLAA